MSQRDSGYERKERDLYETPAWVTRALLPHIADRVDSMVWEPAAASGQMSAVLAELNHGLYQSDIDPVRRLELEIVDFLGTTKDKFDFDFIITNPPYEAAQEFIDHALMMTAPTGLVAMLLRTDFDHAKTRQRLFSGCGAFAKKLVLTKRIKWFADSKGQPSFNHAWFIWDWKHKGPPVLAYGP